jgi:hypothetical protein
MMTPVLGRPHDWRWKAFIPFGLMIATQWECLRCQETLTWPGMWAGTPPAAATQQWPPCPGPKGGHTG